MERPTPLSQDESERVFDEAEARPTDFAGEADRAAFEKRIKAVLEALSEDEERFLSARCHIDFTDLPEICRIFERARKRVSQPGP